MKQSEIRFILRRWHELIRNMYLMDGLLEDYIEFDSGRWEHGGQKRPDVSPEEKVALLRMKEILPDWGSYPEKANYCSDALTEISVRRRLSGRSRRD